MKATLLSLLLVANALASDSADWPCWRGPAGNGAAPSCGKTLVEDLAQARLLWVSDANIPDTYVADARAGAKADSPGVGGGYAAPLVVGNRVYQYYHVPGGTVVDDGATTKNSTRPRETWRVDADDVLHCFDAETGRTLWKAVMAGKGINMSAAFNKGGGLLTPAFANGKVFFTGASSRVYAVDAATGQTLWESNLGQRAKDMEEARAKAHKEKKLIYFNRDFGGTLAVADGVVVGNDAVEYYTKRNGVGNGLTGLDATTGKALWSLPACADWHSCPVKWTHAGKEYILIGSKDKVTSVEPRTGKALWAATDASCGSAVAVEGDLMIANGARGTNGLSCFQISLTGAKRLWSLPTDQTFGGSAPAIYNGHVYALVKPKVRGAELALACIELATGKVIAELPGKGAYVSLVAGDGRVFMQDGAKGDNPVAMVKADAKDFRQLGTSLPARWANSTSPALANGRFYFRTRDRVVCLDLRQGVTAGKPASELAKLAPPVRQSSVNVADDDL